MAKVTWRKLRDNEATIFDGPMLVTAWALPKARTQETLEPSSDPTHEDEQQA